MKKWLGNFVIMMAVAIMVAIVWAPEARAWDSNLNLVNELHVGAIGSEMRNSHKASVGVSEKLVYNIGRVSPILDIGGERTVSNMNSRRDVQNWMLYATVGAKYPLTDSVNLYASIGPGITSTDHSDSNSALVWKVSAQFHRFAVGYMHADAHDEGNTSLVFAGVAF